MSLVELYVDSIVIDGLIIVKWNCELFEDMCKGGLIVVNCIVLVWEGFQVMVNNIVVSNKLICDNSDLVILVCSIVDICKVKEQGKIGIFYGFQNVYVFEDQIGYVEVFKQFGVGIVQMCYNIQNLVGIGCYECDGGFFGFGWEIVVEMNWVGIMCDFFYVGSKIFEEVIFELKKLVCYFYCLLFGFKEYLCNKFDEELKFIVDYGGFVGVIMFVLFFKKGIDLIIDDYVEVIEYVMNIVGEDVIGIGIDFIQGYGYDFFEWLIYDKGYVWCLINFGKIVNLLGICIVGEFFNFIEILFECGMFECVVCKVMGENWVRVLCDVWGE